MSIWDILDWSGQAASPELSPDILADQKFALLAHGIHSHLTTMLGAEETTAAEEGYPHPPVTDAFRARFGDKAGAYAGLQAMVNDLFYVHLQEDSPLIGHKTFSLDKSDPKYQQVQHYLRDHLSEKDTDALLQSLADAEGALKNGVAVPALQPQAPALKSGGALYGEQPVDMSPYLPPGANVTPPAAPLPPQVPGKSPK